MDTAIILIFSPALARLTGLASRAGVGLISLYGVLFVFAPYAFIIVVKAFFLNK
jgi:hypothetical protein